tara:strand:+ start:115 stop:633 length:519 start_codon:yes stop_codon:yes gene_type:complete
MNDFFCVNKSNIFHIINNNKSCTRKYLNKLLKLDDLTNNRLCKNCFILFIKKYKINNTIYHRYNNNIYLDLLNISNNNLDNILLKEKLIGSIDEEGNININDYYINLISINKKKYYLVNNKDLYNIDNLDIFNINLDLKLGKLLGPKMCIINKDMVLIENNKLKYNLWEIII